MSDNLTEYLDSLIDKLPGNIQIYVKDLRENRVIYEKNADVMIDCTNLLALPTLYGTLNGIVEKKVKLKDVIEFNPKAAKNLSYIVERGKNEYTIEELLEAMCVTNDSNALHAIIKGIGIDTINRFLDSYGLNQVGRKYDESLQNISKIFEFAYKRRMLTPRLCDIGIKYMERNNDSTALTRQIIDNIVIAHLDGATRKSASSIGAFRLDHSEYMIAINISGASDTISARRTIGMISRAIYDNFVADELL